MDDLSTIQANEVLERSDLDRIGDLIFTDGPLLTLFQDQKNGVFYLYDYVDRDPFANRWIIYRVSDNDILDYLTKAINHRELFSRAENGRYYYADIYPERLPEYKIYSLRGLPAKYSLTEDSLFDEEFCSDTEEILLFVSRAKATKQNINIYGSPTVIRVSGFADKGISMELKSEGASVLSAIAEVNTDSRLEISNWLKAAEIGPNVIYDGKIKTEEAHVRQTYKLPRKETMEVFSE